MATTSLPRFSRGDAIVYRELTESGEISVVKPATVVEDSDDRKMLWTPFGTPTMKGELLDPAAEGPRRWDQGWRLAETVWRREVLMVVEPERLRTTHMVWNEEREFLGWKIGIQSKPRHTRLGYDRRGFWLAVVIAPDGQWSWKNQDELALYVDLGRVTPEQGEAIRAEGARTAAEVEAGMGPQAEGWEKWRPDAGLIAPQLPPDWDDLSMYDDATAAAAWADDLLHVA